MSRVGKEPIQILQGVQVQLKGQELQVQGPKGKLNHRIPEEVQLEVSAQEIKVLARQEEFENARALQGLTRTLISNMVHGVHSGFSRELDIVGVGYRAAVKGSVLSLTLGYSHTVEYTLPQGVTAKVENNTHLVIQGFDKMLVGQVAAKIRSFREPEPYQGKGIKYTEERIERKQGKAAGAK